MNKKLLCAALLGGLGVAQAASAQTFDDRWYLTGDVGYNYQDNSRDTENAMFAAIGVGKFINQNWSLDGQLNWQNPKQNHSEDLWWSQYGVSLDLRRHFIAEGRTWNPYILMGLGYQRHEEEYVKGPAMFFAADPAAGPGWAGVRRDEPVVVVPLEDEVDRRLHVHLRAH